MYKNKASGRHARIMEAYLGGYRKGLHVREIAKEAKISPSAASYMTRQLEGEGILRHTIEGRNKKYFINLGNPASRDMLANAEIARRTATMEKYFIIKKLAAEVNFGSSITLLFGSFAKGTASEESDIDVMMIGKNNALENEIEKFGKLYGKEVHAISLPEKDFMTGKNELASEVMKSHAVINNAEGFVGIVWRMEA